MRPYCRYDKTILVLNGPPSHRTLLPSAETRFHAHHLFASRTRKADSATGSIGAISSPSAARIAGGLTLPESAPGGSRASSAARSTNRSSTSICRAGRRIKTCGTSSRTPREIRGEFNPIHTNVPGIDICELFPRIARNADKFIFVRTIADADGRHDGYQCMTGRKKNPQTEGYWPMMGSWVSRFQGNANPSIPANLSLMYATGESRWGDPYHGGFLGMGHNPFNMVGGRTNMASANMTLNGVTLDRLGDRVNLMRSFDSLNRQLDTRGTMDGIDSFQQQALGILTSSRLVDALDLSKEDPRVVGRYGFNDPAFERNGARAWCRNFCIARRLVEAGARVVTVELQPLGLARPGRQELRRKPPQHAAPRRRACPRWSKICTCAAWTTMSRWSSGASSAARRGSTTRKAATIGRNCRALCWRAAA